MKTSHIVSMVSVDDHLPRHRHAEPYIAVVLTSGYIEAGDSGRWQARPGTAVVHARNEAHRDTFETAETLLLNLPLASTLASGTSSGAGLIDDIDCVARTAERDPQAAADLVAAMLRPGACRFDDWPDLLARALDADPSLSLAQWAEAHRLLPTSVTRAVVALTGATPTTFRAKFVQAVAARKR